MSIMQTCPVTNERVNVCFTQLEKITFLILLVAILGFHVLEVTVNWGWGIVLKCGQKGDTWKDNLGTGINSHILQLWFGVDGIVFYLSYW
jgi:hypothetical protein